MEQGALGAAGVRRVGYELEVSRSVRTASRAGAYCVATRTACLRIELTAFLKIGDLHKLFGASSSVFV